MRIKLILLGIVFIIVGILFIVYNSRITKWYMGTLNKKTGIKAFKSKGLGIYGRIRFYFAGAFFILFGLWFIYGGI